MNRNFATFALIIWILAYIVSVSPSEVGAAKAELAGKIFWVFFWIWLVFFAAVIWFELVQYGKKSPGPLEKWR